MKNVYKGWVGRNNDLTPCLRYGKDSKAFIIVLYDDKGEKHDWKREDWPPLKVKVTVEVIDEKEN